LRFTFTTAHADAAFLARQVAPKPSQAREQMLELREFNLQLAFARASALRENIENQRRAIEHLGIENLFQVAALRGGKFVVENYRVHVEALALRGEFIRFAFADEGRGVGGFEFLHAIADDFAAGG